MKQNSDAVILALIRGRETEWRTEIEWRIYVKVCDKESRCSPLDLLDLAEFLRWSCAACNRLSMTSNTDPRPGSPNCKTPNWSSCLDATQNPDKAEIANRVFWSLASIWYAAWPESRTDSVRLACKQSKVILRSTIGYFIYSVCI